MHRRAATRSRGDYYSFYQGNLSLLLGNQPIQLAGDQIVNNGNLYFLQQQPGGLYSLYETVPKPWIGLFAGLVFFGQQALRRRRTVSPGSGPPCPAPSAKTA
jgi:hypothetical protein